MADLIAERITVFRGGAVRLADVSARLGPGELVALIGPNGAGKTTLLRAMLGLERLTAGSCALAGAAVGGLNPAVRARAIAYLPQARPLAWPALVADVVALGRFSHGAAPGRLGPADAGAVARALTACGLDTLAGRPVDQLSGGELARVHVARALCSEAPLLLADEPVAALDPRHQFAVMDLIRSFVDRGGGAMVVLHDLALAARYADRLIWLAGGQVVADGPVAATLEAERIEAVFGVRAQVSIEPEGVRVRLEGIPGPPAQP